MYKITAHNTNNLKQRLFDTWANVYQNIIDKAVDQWRKWLCACEKAKGTSAKLKHLFESHHHTQPAFFQSHPQSSMENVLHFIHFFAAV